MNGIGIGSLALAISEGKGSETTLWEKEGRQGPSWIQATVDLPPGNYVVSSFLSVYLDFLWFYCFYDGIQHNML